MKRTILSIIILICFFVVKSYSLETAMIIKVNGFYGIINKGVNQGIKEGQVFYIKRSANNGLSYITKVKVIRTTANRAAVEQLSNTKQPLLNKGDKLYANDQINSNNLIKKSSNAPTQKKTPEKKIPESQSKIIPITEPIRQKNDLQISNPQFYHKSSYNLKNPWLSFHFGAIFPNGELADIYSPSFKLGASYMVTAGRMFNLGLEVNKTFFGAASFENNNSSNLYNVTSSSLLEVFVVFQKYFGDYFFIESGGGIFRPKIRTVSMDNFESTYSTSKFGIFGGTGFFVPTSEYAGFTLKGRIHNYFDQSNKQYFGLTGGFRFKIQ